MTCHDCNKPRLYPILEATTHSPVCPVCFGSNLTEVDQEAIDLAKAQKWYFVKPQ